MNGPRLIVTSDGSHSLLNTELDETYHSIHGAIQESNHVFIKNGLDYLSTKKKSGQLTILEVGFGTGLNALLTLQHVLASEFEIKYTSLEAYPIQQDLAMQLNYPAFLKEGATEYLVHLHQASWDATTEMKKGFHLEKRKIKIQEADLGVGLFDLIYFDAFAPSKQPEMWDLSVLQKVEQSMTSGAVFVTYCAKGQLKRDLKSLGLEVETLPGPPGKKEMIRALKK